MFNPLVFVLSFLIFILSIHGTMALRYFLVVTLILLLVTRYRKYALTGLDQFLFYRSFLNPLLWLLVFVIFVFFHSLLVSVDTLWSLDEMRAHLIYPIIYFFVGTFLANYAINSSFLDKKKLFSIIFMSLFVHIAYLDLVAIDILFNTGEFITRSSGLMNSPVLPNYITNILLAFIIAEYIYRIRLKKNFLFFSNGLLHLILLACIFSSFVEGLRLGDISLALLGISAGIVFTYKNNTFSFWRKKLIGISFTLILLVPLIFNISNDPRWANLIESIPVSLMDNNSMHWLDDKLPPVKTKKGISLTGSNYLRIAMAKEGIKYSLENPFGIGFGRNSFGKMVIAKYPNIIKKQSSGQTSHSSIIDLIIGVGFFGALIWIIFIASYAYTSFRQMKKEINYENILALFLSLGFFFRSVVDAYMRDHMFLLSMMLFGILFVFIRKPEKALE